MTSDQTRVAAALFGFVFLGVALALMGTAHAASATEALDALVAAYPQMLARHDGERIYWRDGTVMLASDGKAEKSFDQLLKDASILDQFHLPYRRGRLPAPPAPNEDPGRFRNEAFFRKMYGDCHKGEIERRLVTIIWLPKSWGKPVRVTGVNGIAEKLKAVSAEIDALPETVKRAAYPIAGVLACRPVRDTGRDSMHAYAAAIDLNVAISDYWLWQAKGGTGPLRYRNRMPLEIVDIFERHGFIWGGKWYHYDTMHFEYRPELLGIVSKPKSRPSRPYPRAKMGGRTLRRLLIVGASAVQRWAALPLVGCARRLGSHPKGEIETTR